MNKTINQLTNLTEISSNDELPIWDNSASDTKKVTVENLGEVIIKTFNTYTTIERFTGKYWIDGKPIYKMVVQSETFTSSSPLSVDISGLDFLIDVRMKRNYDASHSTQWVFGSGTQSANNIIVIQSTGNLTFTTQSSGQTIKNFSAIIEYTKSTT